MLEFLFFFWGFFIGREKAKKNKWDVCCPLLWHYQSNIVWQAARAALDSTKYWRNRMWFSHNSNVGSYFYSISLQLGCHHHPELEWESFFFGLIWWIIKIHNLNRKQSNTYNFHDPNNNPFIINYYAARMFALLTFNWTPNQFVEGKRLTTQNDKCLSSRFSDFCFCSYFHTIFKIISPKEVSDRPNQTNENRWYILRGVNSFFQH